MLLLVVAVAVLKTKVVVAVLECGVNTLRL
jgi:hypothetical protein